MKQFKKIFNHLTNVLFVIILIILIYRFYDAYKTNTAFEGKELPSTTLNRLSPNLDLSSLSSNEIKPPYVVIFWSSTCPPCIVELSRFNSEVTSHTLPADKIIAINVDDDLKTMKKFIRQKELKFPVYQNPNNSWAKFLKLKATPLVVHITKENKIKWMTTGVSPTGIVRAKKLLEK